MEKDRNLRYQHAADMRAELLRLKRNSESGGIAAERETQSVEIPTTSLLSSTGERRAPTSSGQSYSGQTGVVRTQRVSKIIDSLAVLPFENASGNPEHEYLSDGITGSLINTLATLPKLRVMAQSTVSGIRPGRLILKPWVASLVFAPCSPEESCKAAARCELGPN